MVSSRGQSKGCLATFVERKTRFYIAVKMEDRTKDPMFLAISSLYNTLTSKLRKTFTVDRGKEFAQHRLVTEALGVEFYFPEPHQPWTRGTNENTNGLLREYFPKHQDINQWSEVDIQQVINKLNLRPRKCLGWKTPYEVYFKKSLHLV